MTNESGATPRRQLPLPGMAAICLYLVLLAGVIILGVVGGQHYPAFFLIFAAVFHGGQCRDDALFSMGVVAGAGGGVFADGV